jgi:hypothetical protein
MLSGMVGLATGSTMMSTPRFSGNLSDALANFLNFSVDDVIRSEIAG